jgi:glycosyltransferase involved in cell wall biosynthesis
MYPPTIVCGCTKNSAAYIETHLSLLYSMSPLFEKFKMMIYENDSTDNTKEILEEFKKTHILFDYVSENIISGTISGINERIRTQVLAHGRNTLLKYISGYEYMIMVDLDDVIATFKPSQLKYLFQETGWDALFANCVGKYYDIWALRIKEKTPECPFQVIDYDCWEIAQQYKSKRVVSQHQIQIPITNPLIPVDSAFGGFGMYRVSAIKSSKYIGVKNGRMVCEHVEFHNELKKKGARLFICPKFLVNKQDEHIIK